MVAILSQLVSCYFAEVARRRRELPWVRVDKEYRFETDEGTASLAALFRERSQLLVYHFMFGPDYAAGCPSCSASSLVCLVNRNSASNLPRYLFR